MRLIALFVATGITDGQVVRSAEHLSDMKCTVMIWRSGRTSGAWYLNQSISVAVQLK